MLASAGFEGRLWMRWCLRRGPWLALVAAVMPGCANDHHVSAWIDPTAILRSLPRPGVEQNARRVQRSMMKLGMRKSWVRDGRFASGSPFRLLAYEGTGLLGVELSAVRLVTTNGIVLALGPSEEGRPSARPVRRLGDRGQWYSGMDLTGDTSIDVVVRSPVGCLVVWSVQEHGSSPYPMPSGACPTKAEDWDSDGLPELVEPVEQRQGDELDPGWERVLVFDDNAFVCDGPRAQRINARRARAVVARRAKLGPVSNEVRCKAFIRLTLQWAWYSLRAGQKPSVVYQRLADDMRRRPAFDGCQASSVRRWLVRLCRWYPDESHCP